MHKNTRPCVKPNSIRNTAYKQKPNQKQDNSALENNSATSTVNNKTEKELEREWALKKCSEIMQGAANSTTEMLPGLGAYGLSKSKIPRHSYYSSVPSFKKDDAKPQEAKPKP